MRSKFQVVIEWLGNGLVSFGFIAFPLMLISIIVIFVFTSVNSTVSIISLERSVEWAKEYNLKSELKELLKDDKLSELEYIKFGAMVKKARTLKAMKELQ